MRYIIYCGPGIGDWILILPMAKRIKLYDPKSHITAIMASNKTRFKASRLLLEIQDYIDEINYYSKREPLHLMNFFLNICLKRYSYGFVVQYTDTLSTSKWPSKIINFTSKNSCGIKATQNLSIHYDYEIPRNQGIRIVEYPLMMLDKFKIGKDLDIDAESLICKDKILNQVKVLGLSDNQKYISLVLGSAPVGGILDDKSIQRNIKSWHCSNWIQLAYLFRKEGYNILLLGGKQEENLLKDSGLNDKLDNIIILAGKCNILESMAALSVSELVIGADTGLMHCAAVLGIPSLTLFGCTDYQEYLPFGQKSYYIASDLKCSPCFGTRRSLMCTDVKCMKGITVQQVYKKAIEIIESETKI